MTAFRSRFLYPVFILRILLFLFGVGVLIFFTLMGIPHVLDQQLGFRGYAIIMLATVVILVVLIVGGKGVLESRHQLIIRPEGAYIIDVLFRKKFWLNAECKGYSLSKYGNLPWGPDFKVIIFYFHDGTKIEFPQFLYWNFKDIHPALQQHGVPFLGTEPYRWKNPWSRRYRFDQTTSS